VKALIAIVDKETGRRETIRPKGRRFNSSSRQFSQSNIFDVSIGINIFFLEFPLLLSRVNRYLKSGQLENLKSLKYAQASTLWLKNPNEMFPNRYIEHY
jgi:hypothetical protein